MKRSKPMRRNKKPMARAKGPIDKRARARRAAGGKQAAGRPSLSVAEYNVEKAAIRARSRGWCEVCKIRMATDPDHVINRGMGGNDDRSFLLHLCRDCHSMRKAPYRKGRLVYEPQLPGGIYWRVIRAVDKTAVQHGLYDVVSYGFVRTTA
jgi:hypothetical protein